MAQPTQYQRVGSTAFDVTEAGVESLGYLSFDGVDDWMVTPTITPGIDKAQIFAGVRKLSDAAGMLLESSTNFSTTAGTFAVFTQTTGTYGINAHSRADASGFCGYSTSVYAAPHSAVLTGAFDFAGSTRDTESLAIRVNGVSDKASIAGTYLNSNVNFSAHPLYIGSRGGTSLPFNGQIYSLITRFGANLEVAQIESTEAYVAGKTAGVDL
jgi:hypothetical protein